MSEPSEWIWMPHAGHLIVGHDCRFHLNTYVGGYVVSTVGEYWPDSQDRRIHADVRGVVIEGRGDAYDAEYLRIFGFEEVGLGCIYETMVFAAIPTTQQCCPWRMANGSDLACEGYNDPAEARLGHLALCHEWAAKKVPA